MVRALGFSNAPFRPFRAGRLCRGRERWIEPWEPEEGEADAQVHRLVVSGAAFSDLSASDALRGLSHSGVDPAEVVAALFPDAELLAFMEDGHPADIPDDAVGVELYDGHRAGGRDEMPLVRWCKRVRGVDAIRAMLGEPHEDRLRGFAVLPADADPADDEALFDALFPLVGMSTIDSPPARFQPAALPDLVARLRAVVLVHRDKNGSSLGFYSREPLASGPALARLTEGADSLLVPFAIPPMLARWDRALSELRASWSKDRPFPVPEPSGGYQWDGRRRRRGRRHGEEEDEELPVVAEGDDDALSGQDDADDEVDDVDDVDGDDVDDADADEAGEVAPDDDDAFDDLDDLLSD